jgi:general secretion pathway protein K
MILVNIVSLVALASALVALMITAQTTALDRSLRFRQASQAAVLARAGEISAAVALRRDMAEAPETDHLREAWTAVIDREVPIEGGTFTLTATDAQSRFNLNSLGQAAFADAQIAELAASLQLAPEVAQQIVASIRERGPLLRLTQLRAFGVEDAVIARLATLVTTLPQPTQVNLNTASEELIALLTDNPAGARLLVAQRDRAGFVTPQDLAALQLPLPPGTGFTSSHYWVRTTVRIADTQQTLTSLLHRRIEDGRPQVVALARWRGAAAPDAVPPL